MMIIGIDPGISGSICFFQDGIIKDVIEMPTMTDGKKNKRQVNGAQIFTEISERINKFDKKNIISDVNKISSSINKLFLTDENFEKNLLKFFDNCAEKYGKISIALVLLASFSELIRLKYFFHLAGLT